ncbi:MAG: alpha/beta fold hydrolase [Gemmatimonadaceae bacterium]|nr:alpha/beta fold hydrolase [Gemmatimonadaceae bacterium]
MLSAGQFIAAGIAASVALFWLAARRRARIRAMDAADAQRRPRNAEGLVIGAEPIMLTGTTGRAVLLLHGFNDSPQSMAYLATRLHAAGYTVHAPRLPGHGCSLPAMAREQRAPAWRRAVADAHAALAASHAQVFVCGQSMGGALSVLETVERPPTALALLAPYLGMPVALRAKLAVAMLFEPFMAYLRSTGGERSIHDDAARAKALGPGLVTATTLAALQHVALSAEAALPRVQVPTLYLQSRLDNRVPAAAAERHFIALGAPTKEIRWFTGSGHILSVDFEKNAVADAVLDFFGRFGG